MILSLLDKKSFRIVEGFQLNDTDKADINIAFTKLKKALTVSAIPASIELRFRKQLESESYKGMAGNEVNSLDISETERNNFLDSRNGKNVQISKFVENHLMRNQKL